MGIVISLCATWLYVGWCQDPSHAGHRLGWSESRRQQQDLRHSRLEVSMSSARTGANRRLGVPRSSLWSHSTTGQAGEAKPEEEVHIVVADAAGCQNTENVCGARLEANCRYAVTPPGHYCLQVLGDKKHHFGVRRKKGEKERTLP